MDQIETDENIKITYICDEPPPPIRIRREGKKDILTNKFSIGKQYDEATGMGKIADDPRNHYLTPIQSDPCCHDTECGSYWAKIPLGASKPEPVEADQLDDVTQPLPQLPLQPKFSVDNSTATEIEERVVRELCKISLGPCAYRLNPTCTLELDAGDHNFPKLPSVEFGPPVIQSNYKNSNLTKRQLASSRNNLKKK